MALYYYIAGADRSADIKRDSLRIKNQIQQRVDTFSFDVFSGSAPTEWEDVKIYRGTTIAGFSGTTVTLDPYYQTGVSFFYAGQKLKIRIGDSDEEEVEVSSYDEAALTIELVTAPSGTVSVGDKIGEVIFGGTMLTPTTVNVDIAENVEYECEGTDYTKIFDKSLVSDTWEDVDSRYIINSVCNSTVNYNQTIDVVDYDDNTAIQAEYAEGGDGNNPTIDSTDYLEGNASGVFGWTNSSGTAYWEATPASLDISDLVGVSSGNPTEGFMMAWGMADDFTNITAVKLRIGSDSSNYAELTFTALTGNVFQYMKAKFTDATITGTPDWTSVDYTRLIIEQTGTGSLRLNGLRVNHDSSFTLFNVQSTPDIDDYRAPRTKPASLMQTLSKTWEYIWFIDYDRDIHFKALEDIADVHWDADNNNVLKLKTSVDASKVGNRIQIEGGEEISQSTYAEVKPGDDAAREWLMKGKFSNLTISIDTNSTTDTAGAGTNTTNVEITAHGLSTGDHIVNRTRGVVREVTVVDVDNVTVESVTSQTSGDTISFFATSKTIGVEGLDDESFYDYMANSNEKSVRATESESTLTSSDYIRFAYNERVPIQLQYHDTASSDALKAMGIGDGIIDLDPIIDQNIDSKAVAIAVAAAKVGEFSNSIIDGSYRTERHGVQAGRKQRVIDSNRSFNAEYVIQTVSIRQRGGEFSDNFEFAVKFGTTLYGWIEFMQKLLSVKDRVAVNPDAIVATFVTSNETVESSDVNQVAKDGGFKSVKSTETVEASESNTVGTLTTGTWRFEPNGVGQTFQSRFNLADFG